jgi:putative tryptophan/tyrosine transport system substrate-binding protein
MLRIKLQVLGIESPDDFESGVQASRREKVEALIVLPDGLFTSHRRRLVDLINGSNLAAVFYDKEFVVTAGLTSCGVSYPALFRRAAYYVDKILKGAKPTDLPVEQPTKFELVVNLKTAKQIGLTIPPLVLMRADKVIK